MIDRLPEIAKGKKVDCPLARRPTRGKLFATPARTMKPEYVEKQKEYEAKKARAKALKLRLTCTICGTNPKTLLNCPCGTTQCVPAHGRVGGGALARDATPQVLLDRVPKNRLARPRPPQGVQEDPKRARGGGGAG